MNDCDKIRVVTFRAEGGYNYSASQGDVTVHGWARGTKREAEKEAKDHLREELGRGRRRA